jgi:hypothetical protein
MSQSVRPFTLLWLLLAMFRQLRRRPYLSASVLVHALLLALWFTWGDHQQELQQRATEAVEVASSLRATSVASTAKRLQDLQTIQELLEKSAARSEEASASKGKTKAKPKPTPATAAPLPPPPPPTTPQEMLQQARALSKVIDAIDQKMQAEELAKLTGVPAASASSPAAPPTSAAADAPTPSDSAETVAKIDKPITQAGTASAPTPVTQQAQANTSPSSTGTGTGSGSGTVESITPEKAANEIAAIETKARAVLSKHQQRLQAKLNGIPVQGATPYPNKTDKEGAPDRPAAAPDKAGGAETQLLAEIADFMNQGTDIPGPARSTKYGGENFFDHGHANIPPVDTNSLVLGSGRMLGAGGEFASRVYLNSWYLIGPFDGRHGADIYNNPAYPPEKAVLLDAVYYGKDKRLLKWRYVTSQTYPLVPPDQVEDSVYYGYTELSVDQDSDLTAWIGADDDVQIYLNDRLVWKGGNVNKAAYFDTIFNGGASYLRDYNRTEGKRVLHFNKGRNKLFFKLSNGPNDSFLSMVLTKN